MQLVLNEEEQLVRKSAAELLADLAGPGVLRKLRDSKNPQGYSAELWQQMIELGWPGVLISEQRGGLGLGHVAMGQIIEQAGCALASSPLFATAIVGASALTLAGTKQQKAELLPAVALGKLTLALALDETPRHDPTRIAIIATPSGGAYQLNGFKSFVVDGAVADQLIVAARTSGEPGANHGITLFLVPRKANGVEVSRTPMVDSRNAADIRFANVTVAADQILGTVDQGFATLDAVLNIANAHLAAELLGIASESFRRTLEYLKDRKQFGVAIGSFQALQHRAAILWTEIELCKSLVIRALRGLDDSPENAGLLTSMAKAKLCQVAELATNAGIQMHGGIGMTDQFDMGFFLKRARVAQALFGDQRFHLNRFARLSGY
jgi:alkylation response protein AidB-like acyl-CoA dehydrogenase